MISVIILTKNEEKNIENCLKSVLWADEIIVIDDYSDDKTVEKAKKLGAIVYFHNLDGNFAKQRTYGLAKAKHDWVFFLDADERVSEKLQREILETITARRNRYSGFILNRKDFLFGKALARGENGNQEVLRLARKENGEWKGTVHETWLVTGHIGKLSHPLLHYPHQSIKEFLAEINYYTDLRAKELYKENVSSSWWNILLYTNGKFIQDYFLKLGILDGMPGFISALMMSFHSFLVRAKLWLLQNEK